MNQPAHVTPVVPHPPSCDDALSGYASAQYAESLRQFGEPLRLSGSGGYLLKRTIPGCSLHDAMGCYPVFACADWSRLAGDLAELEDALVSVALVADPLGAHSEKLLRSCFPDLCVKYKDHYVVHLDNFSLNSISPHHRRNVRRGSRNLRVEFCDDLVAHLDDWSRLYDELIRRHDITGISAFSRDSFQEQMRVPGLRMQRAIHAGETVGMALWLLDGRTARYHLGAYNARGYELRASYALFWSALNHFRGQAELALLGAAAGAEPGKESGLDRFKAGWATGTEPAFLCGRILSPTDYAALCAETFSAGNYFPAYRAGEIR